MPSPLTTPMRCSTAQRHGAPATSAQASCGDRSRAWSCCRRFCFTSYNAMNRAVAKTGLHSAPAGYDRAGKAKCLLELALMLRSDLQMPSLQPRALRGVSIDGAALRPAG